MDIKTFASNHHLRLKRPPDGYEPGPHPDRPYIPGCRGWITENASSMKLFVQTNRVGETLRQAVKLGMQPQGRGDYELMLWFDPSDAEQANFALQTVKAYRKRTVVVTPEMLARLRAAREARTMPVPDRNFYEEGGLQAPCPAPLGSGQPATGLAL